MGLMRESNEQLRQPEKQLREPHRVSRLPNMLFSQPQRLLRKCLWFISYKLVRQSLIKQN